jgi:2-polyprenyl-3-methyl-5-hydroxy-6-metoxy-1,4-benzoquinol methylase
MFSLYCPGLFHRVAICRDCGHIQIDPLFSEKDFATINESFIGRKYLTAGNQNPDNVKKEKKLDEILSSYLREGMKILDVGPGEAWAMRYFQNKKCHYNAIEPIEKLAVSIRERGGVVIGKSLFDNYSKHNSYFDIIVFRHVLEHMLNPIEALSILKSLLKSNGLIYLALPNASKFSIRKGFRTSFLRPIHISYFCVGNVLRIVESAGLKSISTQSTEEISCLLRHGNGKNTINENFYNQQRTIFLKMKYRAFPKDMYKIGKTIAGKLLKRTKFLCN